MTQERRTRGYLAMDVDNVCKMLVTGEVTLPEGRAATPSVIANLLVEVEGLDREDRPSTGAVDAILRKWEKIGYAEMATGPYSFVQFTEEGQTHGKDKLEEWWKEANPTVRKPRAEKKPEPEQVPASLAEEVIVEKPAPSIMDIL